MLFRSNLDARAPRPGIVAGDNTGLSMNKKAKVGLFLEHQHDQNGSVQVIPTSSEAVAQTRREDHGDLDHAVEVMQRQLSLWRAMERRMHTHTWGERA